MLLCTEVKERGVCQLPVSHGSAVVARDEAVGSGVARQDVGDAELGHVAVVGAAAWGRGFVKLNQWAVHFYPSWSFIADVDSIGVH